MIARPFLLTGHFKVFCNHEWRLLWCFTAVAVLYSFLCLVPVAQRAVLWLFKARWTFTPNTPPSFSHSLVCLEKGLSELCVMTLWRTQVFGGETPVETSVKLLFMAATQPLVWRQHRCVKSPGRLLHVLLLRLPSNCGNKSLLDKMSQCKKLKLWGICSLSFPGGEMGTVCAWESVCTSVSVHC